METFKTNLQKMKQSKQKEATKKTNVGKGRRTGDD